MTDIWIPSDELLLADPIAKAKVDNPYDAIGDQVVMNVLDGIPVKDIDDDEANAEAAACVLAEAAGDELTDDLDLVDDTDDEVEDTSLAGDALVDV